MNEILLIDGHRRMTIKNDSGEVTLSILEYNPHDETFTRRATIIDDKALIGMLLPVVEIGANAGELKARLIEQMAWNCWRPASDEERERAKREWESANKTI